LRDFKMLTPGVNVVRCARRETRKTRAATRAARKYPIPATAKNVVTSSRARAKLCGITAVV